MFQDFKTASAFSLIMFQSSHFLDSPSACQNWENLKVKSSHPQAWYRSTVDSQNGKYIFFCTFFHFLSSLYNIQSFNALSLLLVPKFVYYIWPKETQLCWSAAPIHLYLLLQLFSELFWTFYNFFLGNYRCMHHVNSLCTFFFCILCSTY